MGSKAYQTETAKRPVWQDISARFSDPRDCLVSFLALETAEILAGAKPANLISIANRERSCGRNLYLLWKEWGKEVLKESGLVACELNDRGESVMLLIYHPDLLADLLGKPAVSAVLRKAGYPAPSSPEKMLKTLAARSRGESFPHEIGVFLGYPLKDVAGFMGWISLPMSCQGPWKIYGDPRKSLNLAETFRRCRRSMVRRLAVCLSPAECLALAA
jgi:uncharacterized protein DUF3793